MKITLALLLLFSFTKYSFSQNTGFLGKKLLLKVDVINGRFLPFSTIQSEFVFSRKFSATASAGRFSMRPLKQVKNKSVIPGFSEGFQFRAGSKFYLESVIPAPIGFYTGIEVGYGMATIYAKKIIEGYHSIVKGEGNFIIVSIPMGVQKAINKNFLIDFQFSVDYIHQSRLIGFPDHSWNYPFYTSNLNLSKAKFHRPIVPSFYVKIGYLVI